MMSIYLHKLSALIFKATLLQGGQSYPQFTGEETGIRNIQMIYPKSHS